MREIDLASNFAAPVIIHGSVIVEPRLIIKSKQKAIENFLHSVNQITGYAKKKNVEIYIENLSNYVNYRPFHYIFTTADEFRYIFDNVKDAKFFLDIGHANVCGGNIPDLINEFWRNIAAMSLSNNDGVRDQHLRLTCGKIDYHKIVKTIINCGWSGLIAFETRGVTPENSLRDLYNIYIEVKNNGDMRGAA